MKLNFEQLKETYKKCSYLESKGLNVTLGINHDATVKVCNPKTKKEEYFVFTDIKMDLGANVKAFSTYIGFNNAFNTFVAKMGEEYED